MKINVTFLILFISTLAIGGVSVNLGSFVAPPSSGSGGGLTTLNGLNTETNPAQTFAVGTSGTDFAISSSTSTHTFNIPTASATNRGLLSTSDWSTFNAKAPTTAPTFGTSATFSFATASTLAQFNGSKGLVSLANGSDGQVLKMVSGAAAWATSTVAWSGIDSGSISDNAALTAALALKAPLASPTFSGTITTPLTASRVLVSGASSELAASGVTATTLAFLDATSSIQTQLNAKAPSASPTFSGTITTPLTASRAVVTNASSELTTLQYTNANTASTLVQRDASGNFTAGTITAALSGNASTATAFAANPTDCGVGEFANAIDASGNLTCATPAGGVSGSGASGRVAYWTGSGTLASSANFTETVAAAAGSSNLLRIAHDDTGNTASHAYLEAAVAGTGGGDPHLRFTIPSGTSWYIGGDNSNSDALSIGTGTAVGTNEYGNVSSAGAWTLGASGGTENHLINGHLGINAAASSLNIFVARKDQASVTRSFLINTSASASAYVRHTLNTDAGDFNIDAYSTAGGAVAAIATDSTFTGGFNISAGGNNTLRLKTNSTDAITISGAQVIGLNGPTTITNSSGPILVAKDGGTFGTNADPYIGFNDTSGEGGAVGFFSSASNNMYVRNGRATGSLLFQTNATTYMSISSAGLVGIVGNLQMNSGATSAATSVISSGVADGATAFSGGSSGTNGGNVLAYGGSHATKAGDIEFRSGSTVNATLDGPTGQFSIPATTASTSASTGALVVSGGMALNANSYMLNGNRFSCVTDGGCTLGRDGTSAGTGSERWSVYASQVSTNSVTFGENSSTVATSFNKLSTTSIDWKSGGNSYVTFAVDYATLRTRGGIAIASNIGENWAVIPGASAVTTTTDATVTTVYTTALGAFTNHSFNYMATCIGRDTSDGSTNKFRKDFVVTNVSGTVTLLDSSAVGTDYNPDTLGGIDGNISSNAIQVRVTGKSATTVKWWCTVERSLVS